MGSCFGRLQSAAISRAVGLCGVLLASNLVPKIAHAADPLTTAKLGECARYVGTTIRPKTFDAAVAAFAKLTPKGEYETSAQYKNRVEAAIGDATADTVISKTPENRDMFKYDADNQILDVGKFAFNNILFDAGIALQHTRSNINIATAYEKYIVVSHIIMQTGNYIGQNSFGAHAKI